MTIHLPKLEMLPISSSSSVDVTLLGPHILQNSNRFFLLNFLFHQVLGL